MSDGTWHLPVAIGDDWEGRHHDHSTEVEPSWAVAQLVVRNHNLTAILTDLTAILTDLIAELYGYADSGVDSGWAPLYSVIDRAEARLRQITEKVTGDE